MQVKWSLGLSFVALIFGAMLILAPEPVRSDEPISSLPYFDKVSTTFELTADELAVLSENNFVVLNRLGSDDLLDMYDYYWTNDLPVIVTTDAILQSWHLIFDGYLKYVEAGILTTLLERLSLSCLDTLSATFDSGEQDETVVRDVRLYFAVAAQLANPEGEVDPFLLQDVRAILSEIMAETPLNKAVNMLDGDPSTKRFIDDFSLYKPRGHYTESEVLENYFRLFKWLSRIPFYFNDTAGLNLIDRTYEDTTREALLLSWVLRESSFEVDKYGFPSEPYSGFEVWKMFTDFLDVVIGTTYAISPLDIDAEVAAAVGDMGWSYGDLNDQIVSTVRMQIVEDITYSSPLDAYAPDLYYGQMVSPKTLVFLGERLTQDTFALNHLTSPYVFNRALPNGLDFASSSLFSARATQLLKTQAQFNYGEQLKKVQGMIAGWPEEEKQTIYWQWVESLGELTVTTPRTLGNEQNLPMFMTTPAWLDEKLTTVMGSWAQLKHDSILYSKQGSSFVICMTPEGYVEPYPQFYQKLRSTGNMFFSSLGGLLEDNPRLNYAHEKFNYALHNLEDVAQHELKGEALNETEKAFINNTFSLDTSICGGPYVRGWLAELVASVPSITSHHDSYPNSRASTIADIHTDYGKTQSVLEVGTGLMEHLIAAVPGFDGTPILAVGPVFSYYEAVVDIDHRMTDEDWRSILNTRIDTPSLTDFSLFKRGYWAESYMVDIGMTVSRLYVDPYNVQLPDWLFSADTGTVGSSYSPTISAKQLPLPAELDITTITTSLMGQTTIDGAIDSSDSTQTTSEELAVESTANIEFFSMLEGLAIIVVLKRRNRSGS